MEGHATGLGSSAPITEDFGRARHWAGLLCAFRRQLRAWLRSCPGGTLYCMEASLRLSPPTSGRPGEGGDQEGALLDGGFSARFTADFGPGLLRRGSLLDGASVRLSPHLWPRPGCVGGVEHHSGRRHLCAGRRWSLRPPPLDGGGGARYRTDSTKAPLHGSQLTVSLAQMR